MKRFVIFIYKKNETKIEYEKRQKDKYYSSMRSGNN